MSDTAATAVVGDVRSAGPSLGSLTVRDTNPLSYPDTQGSFRPGLDHGQPQTEGGIDVKRLVHALRRRWLPAAVLGSVLAAAIAIPTWYFLPKGFEAVVWLRIRDKGGMLSSGGRDTSEYESYRKTQLQLLRSPVVLNAALRRPGVSSLKTVVEQDDPVRWLAETIEVAVPPGSEVMQLKLRAPLAEDASKVLNAVTACYLDDIVNKDRQERLSRRDLLEKKYKENQAELRSRREIFNELAKTLGTRDSIEVATQRSLLLDHLSTVRAALVQAEKDLAIIDTELAVMEMQKNDGDNQGADGENNADGGMAGVSQDMVDAALSREPEIRDLTDRISGLTSSIQSQEQRSARGASEPAVKRMKTQRKQLQQQLVEVKNLLREQVIGVMSQGPAGAGVSALSGGRGTLNPAVLRLRREGLLKVIQETTREKEELSKEVTSLGQANADMEVRKGEIEQLHRVTDQIGLQLEATSLDLTAPARVQLLEEAAVPESDDKIQRIMISLLAGCAGLTLGGGAVVLLEYMRNKLGSPDVITQRLGLRLIGTVPWVSGSRRDAGSEYRLAESVDSIRTVVLHGGRDVPKVIMITSPGYREGKSSVAANLAASIARSDKRTLLLEGNLRTPSVHTTLQLDGAATGMSDLLRGEVTANDVIQPTTIEGLFAVAGGNCDYTAINALSRPEFGRIMQGFRDTFDVIVIDAGPVLHYADTLLIGQRCDGVLIATMRDVSSVPAIAAASERLRSAGVRVLGCVMCGTRESKVPSMAIGRPA